MSEETLPSIDTSFFTTAENEEASEWTLKLKDVSETTPQGATPAELFSSELNPNQMTPEPTAPVVLSSGEVAATQTVRKKTRFDRLFKFHDNGRLTRGPIAAGQHLVGEDERLVRLNGEATSYVHHNNMYIHGAALQMGSSASNAQQQEGYDPALGLSLIHISEPTRPY